MARFYLSEDEQNQDDEESGPSTKDISSLGSPSMAAAKPQKHVDWNLPHTPAGVEEKPERHLESDTRLDPQRSREHEDELRRGIHRIFTHESVRASDQRGTQTQDSSQKRKENVPRPRPKSALRSGSSTPIRTDTPPPAADSLDEDVEDRESKSEKANAARVKANQLSESLGSEIDGPPSVLQRILPSRLKRPSRGRSGEVPSLYHDGGELLASGQATPRDIDEYDYVPRPQKYRTATLPVMWLMGRSSASSSRRSSFDSQDESKTPSNPSSPKLNPGGGRGSRSSVTSLMNLVKAPLGAHEARFSTMSPDADTPGEATPPHPGWQKPRSDGHIDTARRSLPRNNSSSNILDGLGKMTQRAFSKQKGKGIDIAIKNHVRETRARQRYILKLCRALMEYGAPTHRLEEYMKMSSRVLETESQFLYLPGCMIVSFDDSQCHTAEVKIVRVDQGVDLGKLRDSHEIYKLVVHDIISVDEAITRLDEIMMKRKKFKIWMLILAYGFASAFVGPFAFQARHYDLPVAFLLGCVMGFLRLVWSPKSSLYSAVFEVFSVVITSFASRAFGSIRFPGRPDEYLFCFSALAQSSIALILPGYILLCGSLELQSRSIVAGSVRMVYALIYTLFLGFGLTVGPALFSLIYKQATQDTTCKKPLPGNWSFFFVPPFAACLMIINQAKWQQMPIMSLIAFAGYLVSHYTNEKLGGNAALSSGLAAGAVSLLANIYSRVGDRLDRPLSRQLSRVHERLVRGGSQMQTSPNISVTGDLEKQDDDSQSDVRQHRQTPFTSAASSVVSLDRDEATEYHRQQGRSTRSHEDTADQQPADTNRTHHPQPRISRSTMNSTHSPPPKQTAYALAASAMLPAIFVLVPSGLSASGSLVAGLETANNILSNTTSPTDSGAVVAHGGRGSSNAVTQNVAFAVGYSVVQIAVGITVGLFLGTIVAYPFGKGGRWGGRRTRGMRSGLFSM